MGGTQAEAAAQRDPIAVRAMRRVTAEGAAEMEDAVAVERWLRILVNGREVAAVMASPGHEEELAAGLLLTRGFISTREEVLAAAARSDSGKAWAVRVVVPLALSLSLAGRATAIGSCGGMVEAEQDLPALETPEPVVRAEALRAMARTMVSAQEIYQRTGGTHGAGVFAQDATPVVVREDVGRHNAVDKALGHCLLARIGLRDKVLVVSGRISREIAAKAVRARVPVLASMSAPTDAGVDLAARFGLTAVGFLRGRRMNIYTHAERVAA